MNEQQNMGYEGHWYTHPPLRNALLAGILTTATFLLSHGGWLSSSLEIFLYAAAILLGGFHWAKEGLEELFKEREIGIEMLMIAATIGSILLDMWDEAAFLVFLYGAAEGLEEYTYAKTRASIRQLLDLAPKEATLLRNGQEEIIPAENIKVGDHFLVRPGEAIPTDGIILQGSSSINEAPVTGESRPVRKKAGQMVFAGTINQDGALTVEATATFADNTLSKMIHLVEQAQEQKGKVQAFIERFGRKYSPAVLLSAIALAVLPPLFGLSFTFWASRAVVLLVAAAPCALIMSTPVAMAAGIGLAGRNGILIKGGVHLENLGKLKALAFDKTGTLTQGQPQVTDIISANGSQEELLQIAFSIEKFSEHPLARAIVQKATEHHLQPLEVSQFKSVAGYGAQGEINGQKFTIGRQEMLPTDRLPTELLNQAEQLRQQAKTVIWVGNAQTVKGLIAIRDEIRPSARQMIETLHRMNIKTAILTGDNLQTAQAIATELQIDEVHAGLKPEEKMAVLQRLQQTHGAVGMIGDGINDAPALAQATVGIAMGVAGTDAAIEAADIALMGDDLSKIPFALQLGQKAQKISKQNIVFSLLILGGLIPAALSGYLSVAWVVFVHEASELLAVANGLRAGKNGNL